MDGAAAEAMYDGVEQLIAAIVGAPAAEERPVQRSNLDVDPEV
jgi:hypothetical protein